MSRPLPPHTPHQRHEAARVHEPLVGVAGQRAEDGCERVAECAGRVHCSGGGRHVSLVLRSRLTALPPLLFLLAPVVALLAHSAGSSSSSGLCGRPAAEGQRARRLQQAVLAVEQARRVGWDAVGGSEGGRERQAEARRLQDARQQRAQARLGRAVASERLRHVG